MIVHLIAPTTDKHRIFERFRYGTEIVEYATNFVKKTHFFQLDISEEEYLILKIQYGNDAWKR